MIYPKWPQFLFSALFVISSIIMITVYIFTLEMCFGVSPNIKAKDCVTNQYSWHHLCDCQVMTVELKLLQVRLWPSTMNQSPYNKGSCKRHWSTKCEMFENCTCLWIFPEKQHHGKNTYSAMVTLNWGNQWILYIGMDGS